MKKFIVSVEDEGKRIDAYLASRNEELSRVAIQRLIDDEKILVNKKKTKASLEGTSVVINFSIRTNLINYFFLSLFI